MMECKIAGTTAIIFGSNSDNYLFSSDYCFKIILCLSYIKLIVLNHTKTEMQTHAKSDVL